MNIYNFIFSLGVVFSNFCFSYKLNAPEMYSLKKNGDCIFRSDISRYFRFINPCFSNQYVVTNPVLLKSLAKSMLNFLSKPKIISRKLLNPQVFSRRIANFGHVKKTLRFLVHCIEEDQRKKRPFRILDPKFINKNFKFLRWSGDTKQAIKNRIKIPESLNIPKGKIRLTNYGAFVLNGSYKRTKKFNCALYKIVDKKFAHKDIFKYTKQDVLDNALHNKRNINRAKPLVWLSQEDLEVALMQGTTYVKMPDKKKRLFVVDKNNGFSYDKKIKDSVKQKRYWYFKEIKDTDFCNRNGFNLWHRGIVFAGDINNIGLGKLIAIKYQNPISKKREIRLGILADTGSAFTNNLYQLDLFAGVFNNKNLFKNWLKQIPNTVEAYILFKK